MTPHGGTGSTAPSSAVHAARGTSAVLLAVLVALALLAWSAVTPAQAAVTSSTTAPSGPAAPSDAGGGDDRGASMDGPESSLLVRAAGATAAPAPSGPGAAVAPGSHPLVAAHLLASPQARPPTHRPGAQPSGPSDSRAPPGPAGT